MQSSRFFLPLVLLAFYSSAQAEAPYDSNAKWVGPQASSTILFDLLEVPEESRTNLNVRGLEIGPADVPVCSDCDYLDANDQLPTDEMKSRLQVGRAQKMAYADATYDVVILKNFPWLLEANIRRYGPESVLADINKMRERSGAEPFDMKDVKQVAAEQKKMQTEVIKESLRVLKPDGRLVILFRGARDYPGDREMYLSHLVELGVKFEMVTLETPNIRDHTNAEAAADNDGYGRALSGIILQRANSCDDQLTQF